MKNQVLSIICHTSIIVTTKDKRSRDATLRKRSNNKNRNLHACTHREADYAFAAQGHAIRLHASYFREGPKNRTNRGYAPAKRQAQVHLSAFISIT